MSTFRELVLRAAPEQPGSIAGVAKAMRLSYSTVKSWLHKGQTTPLRAYQLVQLSDGRLTMDDFTPYMTRTRHGRVGDSALMRLIARGIPAMAYQPKRIIGALNIDESSFYKCLHADRLPAHHVQRLVDLSEGGLSLDDFAPFVLPATPCIYQTNELWHAIAGACGNKWPNPSAIAAALNIGPDAVRAWFIRGTIPYRRAMRLVELSDGRLPFEKLQPFVT